MHKEMGREEGGGSRLTGNPTVIPDKARSHWLVPLRARRHVV